METCISLRVVDQISWKFRRSVIRSFTRKSTVDHILTLRRSRSMPREFLAIEHPSTSHDRLVSEHLRREESRRDELAIPFHCP